MPAAVFDQSISTLRQVVSERQAIALKSTPIESEKQLALCAAWEQAKPESRRVVCLGDLLYPPQLLILSDPPLLFWIAGRIDLLEKLGWPASISIVGSRNPSAQGAQIRKLRLVFLDVHARLPGRTVLLPLPHVAPKTKAPAQMPASQALRSQRYRDATMAGNDDLAALLDFAVRAGLDLAFSSVSCLASHLKC